jgi:hypothetical protein
MKAMCTHLAWASGTHAGAPFRCRLMSRSDVKRTQCACRHQNRQLMCGGRA